MDEPATEIKLIAFDVEGTLMQNDIWTRLHPYFGVSLEQDEAWYADYKSGKLNFRQWLAVAANEWRKAGRKKDGVDAVIEKISYMPGAEHVVSELQKKYRTALISSGADIFVKRVASGLSIPDEYHFLTFEYDAESTFVDFGYTSDGTEVEAKVRALKELGARYNIAPEEMVFVGDSINDIGAFEYTKHGVLYGRGTDSLQQVAWKQITELSELLTFL